MPPNILIINGNPKKTGFINSSLNIIAQRLEEKGAGVARLDLRDKDIKDCVGCFNCLKTGECPLTDDMDQIVEKMLVADGFVVGSPVRNGNVTGLYKRFYERITYRLGFPFLLEHKHTLAISCVGYMTGKKINRKFLGLQDIFYTRLSNFLFFSVGIPTKLTPESMTPKFQAAADKLLTEIKGNKKRSLKDTVKFVMDRMTVKKFMMKKNPEQYANVIRHWQEKGYY